MAMPRPSGKAKKIAEKVVPGLGPQKSKKSEKPRNPVAKYGYDKVVMMINENGGRLPPWMG